MSASRPKKASWKRSGTEMRTSPFWKKVSLFHTREPSGDGRQSRAGSTGIGGKPADSASAKTDGPGALYEGPRARGGSSPILGVVRDPVADGRPTGRYSTRGNRPPR